MRIKSFFKTLITISVAVICTATLAGCFDLGDFSDESAYYNAFGNVTLVYQNPNSVEKDIDSEDYSIKDYFYNKNTGKDFTYGDPEDEEAGAEKSIPQLPYVYMVIPVEQNLSIDSLALYFNTIQTCVLEVSVYVVDNLPDFDEIRLLGEPEYQQKLENGETVNEKINYSDPDNSLIVATATKQLKTGKWDSIIVNTWNNENALSIKKGQYILLRFINNSGENTTDGLCVDFRVTNLLIRAFF